jgi:hypothetical protein
MPPVILAQLRTRRLVAAAFLPLLAIGCGGGSKNFTPEDFKKVTKGLSEQEVHELLGRPADTLEAAGARRSFWKVGDNYYSISFADGKVVEPLGPTTKAEDDLMRALMAAARDLPGGPRKDDPKDDVSLGDFPKIAPKAKFKLPGEFPASAQQIQLSSDGKRLAVAYRTPKFTSATQVWDVAGAEPKVIAEFEGSSFALSPSGKLLLSPKGFFGAIVQEVDSKKSIAEVPEAFSFAFFRDDNTIALTTRSHDFATATKGKITLWDIAKKADAGSFGIPDNRFNVALPARGGKEYWLFMSNKKFEVECYDLVAKKLARTIKPEGEDGKPLTDCGIYESIAPDASAFSTDAFRMRIFDAATGKTVATLPTNLWNGPIGFLGFLYAARPKEAKGTVAGELGKGDLVLYDWKQKKVAGVLTGNTKEDIYGAASSDGKTFVSMTRDGEGMVYDITAVATKN